MSTNLPPRERVGIRGWWLFAWLGGYVLTFCLWRWIAGTWGLPPIVAALIGAPILAIAQCWVLHKYCLPIPWLAWILATVLGCLLILDLMTLLYYGSRQIGSSGDPASVYLLGGGLGLVSSMIIGTTQWYARRTYLPAVGGWILRHTLAGIVSLLVIITMILALPYGRGLDPVIVGLVFTVVGGGITGTMLRPLLRQHTLLGEATPARRPKAPFPPAAIVIMAGLLTISGAVGLPTVHTPYAGEFPHYPSADHRETRALNERSPYDMGDGFKEESFQTDDTPEVVLAYYRKTLLADGWKIGMAQVPATTLEFILLHDCPWHTIVVTTSSENGRTAVQVKGYKNYCY